MSAIGDVWRGSRKGRLVEICEAVGTVSDESHSTTPPRPPHHSTLCFNSCIVAVQSETPEKGELITNNLWIDGTNCGTSAFIVHEQSNVHIGDTQTVMGRMLPTAHFSQCVWLQEHHHDHNAPINVDRKCIGAANWPWNHGNPTKNEFIEQSSGEKWFSVIIIGILPCDWWGPASLTSPDGRSLSDRTMGPPTIMWPAANVLRVVTKFLSYFPFHFWSCGRAADRFVPKERAQNGTKSNRNNRR